MVLDIGSSSSTRMVVLYGSANIYINQANQKDHQEEIDRAYMQASKIKLLLFDLDGTLVDSRPLHYMALNRALARVDPKYVIAPEVHLAKYDARPTAEKLRMLTEEKGLPVDKHREVWESKQEETIALIDQMTYDHRVREVLRSLKSMGYTMYCASNAIWKTVKQTLLRKGFIEYFDYFCGTEDTFRHKPHPEIFLRCIARAGVLPQETIILEDSDIGRKAALNSGAHLLAIRDPEDVTLEKILDAIDLAEERNRNRIMDISGTLENLNIVLPMAGQGSRFANAGYCFPKPLIEVNGTPMIKVVVDNLNMKGRHIFIVQQEHHDRYGLNFFLPAIAPGCQIVQTKGITQGAACSILLAKHIIDNDNPVVIANSDQFAEWSSARFLYQMLSEGVSGGIATFRASHPKWSYVKTDEHGWVTEVREKQVISDRATVGIYYWARGKDFVRCAERMIEKNIRTNNEFYVAPVFNELIEEGGKVKAVDVDGMWGLGTPEDLEHFLRHGPTNK